MIRVRHVSKYFGAHRAVSDLSFDIEQGQIVGLLGLNGAGKTTTLKMLSGVLLPTAGEITIAGHDLASDPESVRSRIGFLPEVPPLYSEMTVEGYLTFVANIKGVRGSVGQVVERALENTDLLSVRRRPIGVLSNGYRRRVGIAQAIVHEPALILLDEPTAGLDPVQIVQMRDLIRQLSAHHTVLVSSHILSEIGRICDRILVLRDGELVAEGSNDDLADTVQATTQVILEVEGARSRAEEVIRALDMVTRLEVSEAEGDAVRLTVEMNRDGRSELARAIVNADLGLTELKKTRAELESIFLKLTGEAPSDASSSAA